MCEYCKPPEIIEGGGLVKGMAIGVNQPLFYGKPEYFGVDPFGVHRYSSQGRPIGIDFPRQGCVLTDGSGFIEINFCHMCGRNLTEE